MDRRTFLKAAGYGLGGLALANKAMAWPPVCPGVLGQRSEMAGSGTAETSWATWLGTNENGWGDSANTLIVMMDSGVANANEIGLGAGLSEANRTLTKVGTTIAAASGGSRAFTNAAMTWPAAAALSFMQNSGGWLLLWKLSNLSNGTGENDILHLYDSGTGDHVYVRQNDATKRITVEVTSRGVTYLSDTTTDALNLGGGSAWLALGYKSGVVKFGFKETTRPLLWTDFDATKYLSAGGNVYDFLGFGTRNSIIGDNVGGNWMNANVHYFIASKSNFLG